MFLIISTFLLLLQLIHAKPTLYRPPPSLKLENLHNPLSREFVFYGPMILNPPVKTKIVEDIMIPSAIEQSTNQNDFSDDNISLKTKLNPFSSIWRHSAQINRLSPFFSTFEVSPQDLSDDEENEEVFQVDQMIPQESDDRFSDFTLANGAKTDWKDLKFNDIRRQLLLIANGDQVIPDYPNQPFRSVGLYSQI